MEGFILATVLPISHNFLPPTNSLMKPKVIVAQLGARMHYAVPVLFKRAGMLEHFFTDFYWKKTPFESHIRRIGGARMRRMTERFHPELPVEQVTSFNMFGIQYVRAMLATRTREESEKVAAEWGQDFAERVARAETGKEASIFYGFSQAALETLTHFKQQGLKGVVEQMSLPGDLMTSIYAQEYSDWYEWEPKEQRVYQHIGANVSRELAEWNVADRIVVASEFVANGLRLKGIDPNKIAIVPYGVDNMTHFAPQTNKLFRSGHLKLIFVGGISVRKGIPYLYEALREIWDQTHLEIEVKCVGGNKLTKEATKELNRYCSLTGHVSRLRLPEFYRWADVFIFPSVSEGSATVIYEALASGLPVITTCNSGSIVRDGIEGFVVPIRDSDALAMRIEQLALDLELRRAMAAAALKRAKYGSWDAYKQRLITLSESLL